MKLYSTVTSERASKSQGGNEYIECAVQNEHRELCAKVLITPQEDGTLAIRIDYDRYKVSRIERIPWEWGENIKGKKQKTS